MCDSVTETFGNQFYIELRRLSGFDFIGLSYDDIQRLKTADRESTMRLVLGNSPWKPNEGISPQEFAAAYVEQSKRTSAEEQIRLLWLFN